MYQAIFQTLKYSFSEMKFDKLKTAQELGKCDDIFYTEVLD